MKKLSLLSLLLSLALTLAACGGGGGGGGSVVGSASGTSTTGILGNQGNTDNPPADTRGYTDRFYVVQNNTPAEPVHRSSAAFLAARKAGSIQNGMSAPRRMASLARRAPARYAESDSGYIDGFRYFLTLTVDLYNRSGNKILLFEYLNNTYEPDETYVRSMISQVSRLDSSLTGNVGPLNLSLYLTANPVSLSLSPDATRLSYSGQCRENGTISDGSDAISYTATYRESGTISYDAYGNVAGLSVDSAGTFALTLTEGWSMSGSFNGATYSGIISHQGVPQASFSGNDDYLTITDYESGEIYALR